MNRKNLPIYGIAGGLNKYRTPKKSKFINLRGSNKDGKPPPEESRLVEEDLFDEATANNNVIQPTFAINRKTLIGKEVNVSVNPLQATQPSTTNENMQSIRLHSLVSQFGRKQKKILCKKYEWIKELGEGAYGQVVLCKQIETEDIVAVKIVSKDIVQKFDKGTAVIRERDLLKELQNPFIIKLLGTKKVSFFGSN